MYPHERSLVNDMEKAGKDFVLIGVNRDYDIETAQQAVQDRGLNWRSFYDGEGGPIVEAYNIEVMPTVVIIDEEGIVRSVSNGDSQDYIVDALLAHLEYK